MEEIRKIFKENSTLKFIRANKEGFIEYTYENGKVCTDSPYGYANTTIEKFFTFEFTPPYELDKDGNKIEKI